MINLQLLSAVKENIPHIVTGRRHPTEKPQFDTQREKSRVTFMGYTPLTFLQNKQYTHVQNGVTHTEIRQKTWKLKGFSS